MSTPVSLSCHGVEITVKRQEKEPGHIRGYYYGTPVPVGKPPRKGKKKTGPPMTGVFRFINRAVQAGELCLNGKFRHDMNALCRYLGTEHPVGRKLPTKELRSRCSFIARKRNGMPIREKKTPGEGWYWLDGEFVPEQSG